MSAPGVEPEHRAELPRIGYYLHTYPRATDTFIQREIAALRARGAELHTFAARQPDAMHEVAEEIIRERARTVYLLPVNPLRLLAANLAELLRHPGGYFGALRLAMRMSCGGWRIRMHQLFYFQEAVLLAGQLRRRGIEHLHNHFGDVGGTVTLLASRLARIGFSITVHGPHLFFDPMRWGLREKIHAARFIACISEYCRDQMMRHADPVDAARLAIIHCGIDLGSYSCRPVSERAARLLYAGRLASEKGLPVLFQALTELAAQGRAWQLTVLGDGPERARLEQMARELGLAERVRFEGYVSQAGVADHLREADVFVLPSLAEGVPVSLMEAMASGVPVVATRVGGVAELVEDGESGLLVPPSDAPALQAALLRYLDDAALRRRIARAGRLLVEQRFSLETEVDKLRDLFRTRARSGEHD